jgi:Flp pilus assembly protein TadG
MRFTAPPTSAFARHQGGAAAVEFAMVSSAFFALILGIAYLGIMLFTNLAVHWALEKGARVAVIDTATTQNAVASAVNGYLNSMGVASAAVTYTVANGAFPVAHISATLTQSYTVPMISNFTITYSANTYVPQGS